MKKPNSNLKRSLSRLMAIQILYQYNFFNYEKKLEEISKELLENYTLKADEEASSYHDKIDQEFLNQLTSGVFLDESIDDEISEFLKTNSTIENIDDIVRQILRLGAFELKFCKDTPFKVIIDEYVDIAASFFDDNRIKFVNGILENLAKKYRFEELNKNKK